VPHTGIWRQGNRPKQGREALLEEKTIPRMMFRERFAEKEKHKRLAFVETPRREKPLRE